MSNLWMGHTFEILLKLEWGRVLKIKLAAVTYSGNDDHDDDDDDDDDDNDDHNHCLEVDGGWSMAIVTSVGLSPGWNSNCIKFLQLFLLQLILTLICNHQHLLITSSHLSFQAVIWRVLKHPRRDFYQVTKLNFFYTLSVFLSSNAPHSAQPLTSGRGYQARWMSQMSTDPWRKSWDFGDSGCFWRIMDKK